ncbi:MAG: substrate-binding domain-containing protein [Gammaproteobacteria bacterium]|nr:substrate-binding domain-containing protein [Gammaproteobacteria bacterium]
MRWLIAIVVAAASLAGTASEDQRPVTLAATTSTDNSGFLNYKPPLLHAGTGIDVRVVVAGTGQAIRYAERGDADLLLVHHTASEEKFISDGHGVERYDLMYNDLVVVGPETDPAGVGGLQDATQALTEIAQKKILFTSRGDDSGTHKRGLALWRDANLDPAKNGSGWYREVGAGQGAALNIASSLGAYCLTDRATWLSFRNRGTLKLLVEGDRRLFNQYGLIAVNPAVHPHTKADAAQTIVHWLLSEAGQTAINGFRIGDEQAFHANAKPSS